MLPKAIRLGPGIVVGGSVVSRSLLAVAAASAAACAPSTPAAERTGSVTQNDDYGYGYEQTYQEPTYQEPTYQEPTYQEPTYQEPTYQEPTYQEPTYQQGGSYQTGAGNYGEAPPGGYEGQGTPAGNGEVDPATNLANGDPQQQQPREPATPPTNTDPYASWSNLWNYGPGSGAQTIKYDDGTSNTIDRYGNVTYANAPETTTYDDGSTFTDKGDGTYSSTPAPSDYAQMDRSGRVQNMENAGFQASTTSDGQIRLSNGTSFVDGKLNENGEWVPTRGFGAMESGGRTPTSMNGAMNSGWRAVRSGAFGFAGTNGKKAFRN